MSFYQFVEEFVTLVLYKVYGTTEYFNIEKIADESYPLIERRLIKIREIAWFTLVAETLVEIGFNSKTQFDELPPFLRESYLFEQLINEFHGLDIAEIFPKLLIPNTLATRLDLNLDYNMLLLRWIVDPESFAPEPL